MKHLRPSLGQVNSSAVMMEAGGSCETSAHINQTECASQQSLHIVFFVTAGVCAVCQPHSLLIPWQMGWSGSLDRDISATDSSRGSSSSSSCLSNGLAHSGCTGHGSHTGLGPFAFPVTG